MIFLPKWPVKRAGATMALVAGLVLSGCGNDPAETEMPKLWGQFLKGIGTGVTSKVAGGAKKTAPAADPAKLVSAALAATPGPISLVVRESTTAVTVMNPVETNADYVTWQAASKQSIVLQQGVLAATRGLGEDLMASKNASAVAAIRSKSTTSYPRSYFHLGGLAETTELVMNCAIKPLKEDPIAIGEINTTATVMTETCRYEGSSLKVKNVYWVADSGRIVKSRQWVSPPVGYLVVQPLR